MSNNCVNQFVLLEANKTIIKLKRKLFSPHQHRYCAITYRVMQRSAGNGIAYTVHRKFSKISCLCLMSLSQGGRRIRYPLMKWLIFYLHSWLLSNLYIKFSFSEKAPKMCAIILMVLTFTYSYRKFYFYEFVANVLRDNMDMIIFDLQGCGGC